MLKKMLHDGGDFQMVKNVKNILKSGNTTPCCKGGTCAINVQVIFAVFVHVKMVKCSHALMSSAVMLQRNQLSKRHGVRKV